MKSLSVLDKSGRQHVAKDEVCKRWQEYLTEPIGNADIRDIRIGTVSLKARRKHNRYTWKKDSRGVHEKSGTHL